jgi:putative ABC transport system permease protein
VPSSRRDEWKAEWQGELHHAWANHRRAGDATLRARVALLLRCLGALPDALWIRLHHGAMPTLHQDVRYAVRSLRRRPGFASVVVLTLAIGIGANGAMFSVVNAVLLRPLPYPGAERLVFLWGTPTDGDSAKVGRATSYPDYLDFREQARTFASLGAYGVLQRTLTGAGEPALLSTALVSSNLFETLGIAPALGRGFLAEEDRPHGPRVAIMGHALWRQRYGGAPDIVGRSIIVEGLPYTVVGVMPAEFTFPGEAQLWTPVLEWWRASVRGNHSFSVVGRLRDGATIAAADAEVREIAARLEAEHPVDNAKRSARLVPMQEAATRSVRPALLMLLGAVMLVLLIACTNIAGLFIARATSRQREAAVRTALGADRAGLVRHFLTESVLLSVIGGVAGVLVARWGTSLLVAHAPWNLTRLADTRMDGAVLGFLAAVSILTGIAFGLLPALQFSRARAMEALREAARGSTGSRGRQRFRQGLVIAQVALAVVLVTGAGLLLKSFWLLQQVHPGFEPRGLVAVPLQLPQARYGDHARARAFWAELLERTRATPGVHSAAIALDHPLDEGWTSSFTIEGRPPRPPGQEYESRIRPVSPGYFRTAGIRLLAGRDIAEADGQGAPGVVVINAAFARLHFPGENPLGRRILRQAWWEGMPSSFEIIGIVEGERFLGIDDGSDPATYFAFEQFTFPSMQLIARIDGDPEAFAATLRRYLAAVDPDLPLEHVLSLESVLAESLAAERFNASLLAIFAAVALLLAAIGIYGVLSYTVAQRTSEIGIRMALGAARARVLGQIVAQGVALAAVGIAFGVLAALALTRVLASLLHEVSTTDPSVFGGVAALLTLVALAAAWLPARRASGVDPMVALRAE